MSNIQTISELCGICEALVHIVEEQRKALAQHDALVLEDEIAKTRSRYTALLGRRNGRQPAGGINTMTETIIVALITGGLALFGTLGGSYLANRKSAALIAYRLEQLEQKVQAHNNLVERMYQVEERTELQEEKIKVANHRIDDLEGFHKPT